MPFIFHKAIDLLPKDESKKVFMSELENVFTSDNVIDLTSDDKAVLFTPPTRVSILLTWDDRPDTREDTLLVELDKVETLVLIVLTADQGSNF